MEGGFMTTNRIDENLGNQSISISPIATDRPQKAKAALDLQLKMVTSSVNHAYASQEYEECRNSERKDELLQYMGDCQKEYFEARKDLYTIDPYALIEFERDLLMQKLRTIGEFHA